MGDALWNWIERVHCLLLGNWEAKGVGGAVKLRADARRVWIWMLPRAFCLDLLDFSKADGDGKHLEHHSP